MKNITTYVCKNCGEEFTKWFGQCPNCKEWGTFEEELQTDYVKSASKIVNKPAKIGEIEHNPLVRISSGMDEFDRVLGGSNQESEKKGFVEGQVVLLSGDPGIGKSTILLQVISNVGLENLNALYVSAEESVRQVSLRAKRLFGKDYEERLKNVSLLSEQNVEKIMQNCSDGNYDFLVLDSIQTVYSEESKTIPGGMVQVKLSTSKLVSYAKQNNIILVLVGHINKEGVVAGPKVLEHLVDSVFQLEGDERSGVRTLRSLKNRFGPTFEVGIFSMEEDGMKDLPDPSILFENGVPEDAVGVCKSVVIEGVRPIIVEVQALISNTPFAMPKRVSEGFSNSRLQRILAIISRYTKIDYSTKDVYAKISSGLKISDPALDLAIAVALISSAKNLKVKKGVVAFGELGLTGNISNVVRSKDRENESTRLGYKTVISASNLDSISKILDQKAFWGK